jgi:hypothetical protein
MAMLPAIDPAAMINAHRPKVCRLLITTLLKPTLVPRIKINSQMAIVTSLSMGLVDLIQRFTRNPTRNPTVKSIITASIASTFIVEVKIAFYYSRTSKGKT